jgi:hypothetical protein
MLPNFSLPVREISFKVLLLKMKEKLSKLTKDSLTSNKLKTNVLLPNTWYIKSNLLVKKRQQ